MRSVDVLAGGRSDLTAFVMISAKGRRHPEILEARSTRNQVALLLEAQFVYVAGADETSMALGARFAEQIGSAAARHARDGLRSRALHPLVERCVGVR